MVDFYRADNTSYPEALLRANPGGLKGGYDPKKCNLWLCRGYQFADNVANVQSYKPGQVVDIEVWIRIPHKGYANVSVVDTASNTVIGSPLKSWPSNYAATANPPADQTKFNVTIPDLGGKCTEAGACVSAPCLGPILLPVARQGGLTKGNTHTGHPVVLARSGADVRVVHRLHCPSCYCHGRWFFSGAQDPGTDQGLIQELPRKMRRGIEGARLRKYANKAP
jgi:hypothetical protein